MPFIGSLKDARVGVAVGVIVGGVCVGVDEGAGVVVKVVTSVAALVQALSNNPMIKVGYTNRRSGIVFMMDFLVICQFD
jgi:hypothetical protein